MTTEALSLRYEAEQDEECDEENHKVKPREGLDDLHQITIALPRNFHLEWVRIRSSG